MKENEIKTFNLDEVTKKAKMPKFVYDEIRLDGTSNLRRADVRWLRADG